MSRRGSKSACRAERRNRQPSHGEGGERGGQGEGRADSGIEERVSSKMKRSLNQDTEREKRSRNRQDVYHLRHGGVFGQKREKAIAPEGGGVGAKDWEEEEEQCMRSFDFSVMKDVLHAV